MTVTSGVRRALLRLVSIGDVAGDPDDLHLRKHVGVAAGYITIVAPLSLPLEAPGVVGLSLGLALSAYSLVNLLILARTKRFERYVIALIASGPVFVFCTNAIAGGVLTSGAASVWTFLTPAYGILALGPRRAIPWLVVFLLALGVNVVFDPVIRTWFAPPPYEIQLAYYVQNVGIPLTITFLLLAYVDTRRRAAEARSDELLTNAIPRSIATRLRHGESRIAEAYPATTVVFCDIESFTPWAARTDAARVVDLLDDLFSRLDGLASDHGVEKIKTVGDAYMAAAGAPLPQADHADRALAFAVAAIGAARAWRAANGIEVELRVGLASGPAVGGVIGRQRMLFDLWGATVNTAQRMEASGVPGRIHLAASTRDLLAASVAESAETRTVEVKGLGEMTTYLLTPPGSATSDTGAA